MPKTVALIAVIALVPINYDHERYEPGEELEIKESELPQLLEVNAVKRKDEDTEDAAGGSTETSTPDGIPAASLDASVATTPAAKTVAVKTVAVKTAAKK